MDFEYKILCCNVAVDVAILCSLEIIVIVATYLTGKSNISQATRNLFIINKKEVINKKEHLRLQAPFNDMPVIQCFNS